jgi:signal transduction histidine kinase
MFEFKLDLDESVPVINVNEFVVWEIVEPLIQNSIDHGKRKSITINIKTVYDSESKQTNVIISDNGIGIKDELLTEGKKGIKKIFLEHETTKNIQGANSGYGCYIAYQLAVEKCGWVLDVENLENEGCKFTITIFN